MRVYLAGAIEAVRLPEALSWREKAIELFDAEGIDTNCPIRDRIPDEVLGETLTLEKAKRIFWHDLRLVDCSDVILANLTAASNGTAMELYHGFVGDDRKGSTYNIAFGYKGKSAFIMTVVDKFCDTLEEAVECLIQRNKLSATTAVVTIGQSTTASGAADTSAKATS